MKEVIQYYWDLRTLTEKYCVALEKNNLNYENIFNMVHQNVTLALEILSYYFQLWSQTSAKGYSQSQIDKTREENWERVLLIESMTFIRTISEMEFCAKAMINRIAHPKLTTIKNNLDTKQRIYLVNVMTELKRNGIINESDLKNWQSLITLRNHLVHNNAVAEEDGIEYVDSIKIEYKKDKQIQGDLLFFPKLTEKSIDLYHKWLTSL